MAELNARIIAKASATASEAPLAADLEVAELAVNTADGKLFTKHTDGSIVTISGSATGGGGGIDSVNGQTGIVDLGIQDMNDFELEQLPAGPVGGNLYSPRVVTNTVTAGQWRHDEEIIVFSSTDSDGVTANPLDGLGVGDSFYCSADDGAWIELIVGPQFNGVSFTGGVYPYYIVGLDTSAPNYAEEIFPGATTLRISDAPGAGSGGSEEPLVEGNILRWNDADQKFKPSSDYISLTALKAEVAAATDFADFQARIAAL